MRGVVFDTSALLSFIYGEPGGEKVASAIDSSEHDCFMHAANVIESCYKLAKKKQNLVFALHRELVNTYVILDYTLDDAFQQNCASLKVEYPMLSLADTMALSLAERLRFELYTTDKEFSRVGDRVQVVQLR